MRSAITLTRNGATWKVKHLPGVPLADQLTEFKAAKVSGDFGGADEVLVVSLSDTIKRYTKKESPAVFTPIESEAPEAEEPKEVKKAKK